MRTHRPRLALVAVLAIALSGCASAKAPTWTFGPMPPAAPAAEQAVAPTPPTPMEMAAEAIEIESFDMGFKPAAIGVAAPGMYDVTFTNTGSTVHDVTFSDGTVLTAEGGKTATGMVTVPADGLTFICSIPGHEAAGMKGTLTVK